MVLTTYFGPGPTGPAHIIAHAPDLGSVFHLYDEARSEEKNHRAAAMALLRREDFLSKKHALRRWIHA